MANPLAQQPTPQPPSPASSSSNKQQPIIIQLVPSKARLDWLNLGNLLGTLAIPLVVLFATLLYSCQQATTNMAQHLSDITIASDQQRAAELTTYTHDMNDLIFMRGLATSQSGDEVRVVARAETLITLRQLQPDGQRKGLVLQFLIESHLITGSHIVVGLSETDLREVHLNWAQLPRADLRYADLSDSNLRYSILTGANLFAADLNNASLDQVDLSQSTLTNADLSGAHLEKANFSGVDLSGVILTGTDLKGAQVTKEQLDQAKSCENMILPSGRVHSQAACKI